MHGIEPRLTVLETAVLPLHHTVSNLAGPPRIELGLTGSKPVVLPLHHEPIKLLLLVLPPGIDPGLLHYQCSVIPLYYESGNPLAALPLPLFLPFQVGVIP